MNIRLRSLVEKMIVSRSTAFIVCVGFISGNSVSAQTPEGRLPVVAEVPAALVAQENTRDDDLIRGLLRANSEGSTILTTQTDEGSIAVPPIPEILPGKEPVAEEQPFIEEVPLVEEELVEEESFVEEAPLVEEEFVEEESFIEEAPFVEEEFVEEESFIEEEPFVEEELVEEESFIEEEPFVEEELVEEESSIEEEPFVEEAPIEEEPFVEEAISEEGLAGEEPVTDEAPVDAAGDDELLFEDFEDELADDFEDELDDGKTGIPPVIDRPLGVDEGEKVVITEFMIKDAKDLPGQGVFVKDLQKKLQEMVEARPEGFTIGRMQEVADVISAYYRERGLILAQAVLPVQDVEEDGIIIMQIFEGRLGRVLVEDNKIFNLEVMRIPFAHLIGEPVVASQIESALLRLTDYPGLTVFGLFQPGLRVGEADLVLKVQDEDRLSFPVRVDNHGTDNTGITRARVGININNPTGGADILSATLQKGFNPNNQRFWSVNYQRTLGPGLLFSFFKDNNQFSVGGEFADRDISGNTTLSGISLSKSFFRSRQRNYGMGMTFTSKQSLTRQAARAISLDELSVLNVSFNYDSVDTVRQGLNFATLDMAFGFNDFFGAMGDSQSARELRVDGTATSRSGPDDTYAEGKFSKAFFTFTRLQTVSTHQSLLIRGEAQWTKDLLTPLEQYSVGGPDNVRGYPVAEILWDRAAFFSLEYLLDAPFIANNLAFGNRRWGELVQMSFFYDQASGSYINPLQTVQQGTETYRSAGWGMRLNVPGRLSSRLMIAVPLGQENTDPIDGSPLERKDTQIWADLTVTF